MSYVILPSSRPSVPVTGEEGQFPVRRILCVGRNYAEHTKEMGGDPTRDPPIFFTKPADAIVPAGGKLPFPMHTANLHHEVELVVAIGKEGTNVTPEQALDLVYGYAVGLDMTRRDLQDIAKKGGQPWDMAKGFDQSCPISAIAPAAAIGHPSSGAITLKVNGEIRQSGNLDDLIWSVPQIISILSSYVTLAPGDLIMTGTPSGVGAVKPGDTLFASCEGVGTLDVMY